MKYITENFLLKVKDLTIEQLQSDDYRKELYDQFNQIIDKVIGEVNLTKDQEKNINLLKAGFNEELAYLVNPSLIKSDLPVSSRVLNIFVFLSRSISNQLVNLPVQKEAFKEMADGVEGASRRLFKDKIQKETEKQDIENIIPENDFNKLKDFTEIDSLNDLKKARYLLERLKENISTGYYGEGKDIVQARVNKFNDKEGSKAIDAVINTVFSPFDLAEKQGIRSMVVKSDLIRSSLDKLSSIINNLGSSRLMEDYKNFRQEVSKVRFKDLKRDLLFAEKLEDPNNIIDNIRIAKKQVKKIKISPREIVKECEKLVSSIENLEEAKEKLKEKLIRTIASSIYDSPAKVIDKIAHYAETEVVKDIAKSQAGIAPTDATKEKLLLRAKRELEIEDDHIYNKKIDIKFIDEKITPILDQAFEKLSKEGDKLKALAQDDRSWYDFSGKIYDSLASAFRSISLIFGAEQNTKELFSKLSQVALNEKRILEKKMKNENKEIEAAISKDPVFYEKAYEEFKDYLKQNRAGNETREEEVGQFARYIRETTVKEKHR